MAQTLRDVRMHRAPRYRRPPTKDDMKLHHARRLIGPATTGIARDIGTNACSQAFSTQSAGTVKAYWVTSGHIDPMGGCQGSVGSARLIACLQPHRRVDIEVTAMR